jgi:hypothetical protein
VRATDKEGRVDEDFGAVSFPETLRGEARANTILKAITKAKRRVTLSICGLGFLDETEVENIPAARHAPPAQISAPSTSPPDHDPETGEVIEDEEDLATGLDEHKLALAEAATIGTEALRTAWLAIPRKHHKALKAAKDNLKTVAEEADEAVEVEEEV